MTNGPAPKPAVERFWPKVVKTHACWNWTGAIQREGYGRFMVTSRPRVLMLAHRFAYEALVGPIEGDLTIDHLCLNRACVNPAHLEPVTREENGYRGNRNVGKTHCDHGHAFTPDNIYTPPSRPHVRDCLACRRERHAVRKAHAASKVTEPITTGPSKVAKGA